MERIPLSGGSQRVTFTRYVGLGAPRTCFKNYLLDITADHTFAIPLQFDDLGFGSKNISRYYSGLLDLNAPVAFR